MLQPIIANGKTGRQSTPLASSHTPSRRAAIYARVSSEEQRQNQTIEPQIDAAKHWVKFQQLVDHPIDITELYIDDGVSGTIALAERPAGKRLLEEAAHGKFELVLVYKIDRLGRDPRDILNSAYYLDQLDVAVKSLTEEFDLSTPSGKFMFNVFASAAGFAKDTQLERMRDATNYWASQGQWMGGVVPYGYAVVGTKKEARLVVSETLLPGLELSAADVVRLIYRYLSVERWTCVKIAEHLNALGIPTAYTRLQRTIKEKVTSGAWTYSTVRKLAANPVYKGEHHFGKRSKKPREVIIRKVPHLVEGATWERAQETLRHNMLAAMRNAKYQYLLRGLITCDLCKMTMAGHGIGRKSGRVHHYYVCGGKNPHRSRIMGKCPSKHIRAQPLEEAVWQEIHGFVSDPGPVLEQLAAQLQSQQLQTHDLEQERLTTALSLSHKDSEKEQILTLYRRGRITEHDLERQLTAIADEAAALKARLVTVETRIQGKEAIATRLLGARQLLDTLRTRLKDTFTWEEKRELVENLVLGIQVDAAGECVATYAFDGNAAKRTVCGGVTSVTLSRPVLV